MSKLNKQGRCEILLRVTPELKAWLDAEKVSSGRSLQFLCNHAIELWRDRLEKGRSKNAADEAS